MRELGHRSHAFECISKARDHVDHGWQRLLLQRRGALTHVGEIVRAAVLLDDRRVVCLFLIHHWSEDAVRAES